MSKDIFSNYIKKLYSNSRVDYNGDVNVNANSSNKNAKLEIEKINMLKEISRKLDKISQIQTIPSQSKKLLMDISKSDPELTTSVDIAIKNGMIVIPDVGILSTNVYIKNGKIHSIGNHESIKANHIIDATGKYVMPGIVEPHVHLGLFAPLEEELQSETKAALLGGITTIGCFFASKDSHLKTFPYTIEKIGSHSYTDIVPHLVISSEEQRKEIRDYVKKLGVTSFKVYMNGIPGLIPDVDDGFILDVFDEIKECDNECIVCVHAENRYIVRRANRIIRETKGINATIRDWTDTHPAIAEEEAIIRLSYLAEKSQVPVYIVHVSSKEAINRLRSIKPYNKFINVETTSPYLSITNNCSDNFDIKMEPPFRSKEDVEALWKAVEDDIVDSIGTDNVTMTRSEKKMDKDLWSVVPGYAVLQTHLPVLLNEGVYKRKLKLEKLIGKITKKPAEIFGLYPRKGTILPGSDADIAIVDINLSREVKAKDLSSRSDFSIYEGELLRGWPVTTIKSGEIVVDNGKFIGALFSGFPILYPSGILLGASPIYLAGAILSGAIFGDNIAPISDTTIASATSQHYKNKEGIADVGGCVATRIKYALIAGAIACVFFFIFGGAGEADMAGEEILAQYTNPKGLIMLIPVTILLAVAVVKRNIFIAITWGIVSGTIIGLVSGIIDVSDIMSVQDGTLSGFTIDGIKGMLGTVGYLYAVAGIMGILDESGTMDKIIDSLLNSKLAETDMGSEIIISLGIIVSSLCLGSANGPAIIMYGPIADEIGRAKNLHPYRRANLLDGVASTIPVIVPFVSSFIFIVITCVNGLIPEYPFIKAINPLRLATSTFHSIFLLVVFAFSIFTGWGRIYEGPNGEPVKENPEKQKVNMA